jgi:catechol 2,3-dioxygenase-like lactoylglutathione lyase family enzyme
MPETVFTAIDHVQLAMPPGEEERARTFYCNQLGMSEIPKPPALADRGGCWFVSGTVQIHLGVESNFRAARKAHPALCCGDYDLLVAGLRRAGVLVQDADDIPGVRRCHLQDPFGNRIELLDPTSKETA